MKLMTEEDFHILSIKTSKGSIGMLDPLAFARAIESIATQRALEAAAEVCASIQKIRLARYMENKTAYNEGASDVADSILVAIEHMAKELP